MEKSRAEHCLPLSSIPGNVSLDHLLPLACPMGTLCQRPGTAQPLALNCSQQKQPSYAFQGFDLPRSVTVEMRALLVDWLVQVHVSAGLGWPDLLGLDMGVEFPLTTAPFPPGVSESG